MRAYCSCCSSQKEWLELFFKSVLCSFLMRKLKTGLKNLYPTFWLCFYKKRVNRSCRSFQKEWTKQFALLKREKERFALLWQKRAIRTKNQRANSQPCQTLLRHGAKYMLYSPGRRMKGKKWLIFHNADTIIVTYISFLSSGRAMNILATNKSVNVYK